MVYIIDAKRTAIGSFNGSLSKIPAHQLGGNLISFLIKNNQLDKKNISEVIIGQVLTASQGQNPARQASIFAGVPYHVPAMTINQVCGSGLRAVCLAFQAIKSGDGDLIIAGGQENMTLAHHSAYIRQGMKFGDLNLQDTMQIDGLTDAFSKAPMGITAENVAVKYNISREEQDLFAFSSQAKAAKAIVRGEFEQEILPIKITSKKEIIEFKTDEYVRLDTSIEKLNSLKPAFKADGTVTAGNSSGINDGAAMLLLASNNYVVKNNIKPVARIISHAHYGVDPQIMGIGPVFAVKEALKKAKWNIEDLDLIECNEAFAAQAIAVNKELNWDINKVNVNGGAIALGHPIGSSGARILVSLIHKMKKSDAHKGIATLCVGGGMGVAVCIEII